VRTSVRRLSLAFVLVGLGLLLFNPVAHASPTFTTVLDPTSTNDSFEAFYNSNSASTVAIDPSGNVWALNNANFSSSISVVKAAGSSAPPANATTMFTSSTFGGIDPFGLTFDSTGNLYVLSFNGWNGPSPDVAIWKCPPPSSSSCSQYSVTDTSGIIPTALLAVGQSLYMADFYGNIYTVPLGSQTPVAFTQWATGLGNCGSGGLGSEGLAGLATDGTSLYLADSAGTACGDTPGIYKIPLSNSPGQVGPWSHWVDTTDNPIGLAVDSSGNLFYATHEATIDEIASGSTSSSTYAAASAFPGGVNNSTLEISSNNLYVVNCSGNDCFVEQSVTAPPAPPTPQTTSPTTPAANSTDSTARAATLATTGTSISKLLGVTVFLVGAGVGLLVRSRREQKI
jgi:hypothetical protein